MNDSKEIVMDQLIDSLQNLLTSGWDVLIALLAILLPWSPLLAWVAFWLLAVNWVKLREVMIRGGWVGVVLIGLTMILIWGVVAPPAGGTHHLFGLNVTNFVGKTVYVTALLTIMFLCGSVQLSGACGSFASFPEPVTGDHDHCHDSHGHDSHGDGSQADHAHGHEVATAVSHDPHGH
jgi:hypothetical protein